jgi:pimeloyl-ACP methyl ester carboxylesterase
MVAQHYASRHLDHPAGLVLISTMARFDLDASVDVFRRLGGEAAAAAAYTAYTDVSEANRERYFEICGPLYTRRPGSVFGSKRIIWNHELAEHFIEGEERTMDLRPGLAAVEAPCLILVGSDDPVTPVSAAVEIRDTLTSTTVDYREFEDRGHGVHRDQLEATMDAITSFVAKHGTPDRITVESPGFVSELVDERPNDPKRVFWVVSIQKVTGVGAFSRGSEGRGRLMSGQLGS